MQHFGRLAESYRVKLEFLVHYLMEFDARKKAVKCLLLHSLLYDEIISQHISVFH